MEKDRVIKNIEVRNDSNTSRVNGNSIQCALKGFLVCPHHDCDGYHRKCEFWRTHSSK